MAKKSYESDWRKAQAAKSDTSNKETTKFPVMSREMKYVNKHLNKIDYQAMRDEIEFLTGKSGKDVDDMVHGIDLYTGAYYDAIRAYQRGERPNASDELKRAAEGIEKFILNAPEWNGADTYRGITLSQENLANIKVGDIIDMKGTSSWSTKNWVAKSFAGWDYGSAGKYTPTMFHLSGLHKNATSTKFGSSHDGEDEVTASIKARYKVTGKRTDAKGRVMFTVESV